LAAGCLQFTEDLDFNVGGLLKLNIGGLWLAGVPEWIAAECARLRHFDLRLDLLEELDMEAVIVVGGVDSVDTHAGGDDSLEEESDVRSCSWVAC
jgi:hypothetical protein